MRLTCHQEELSQGLSVVGRAVATRTTLPITQNVLIATDKKEEAQGGRLKLSATNLEIAITTWVGSELEEEGSITVPARLLTEFVMSLPATAGPDLEANELTLSTTDQPLCLIVDIGKEVEETSLPQSKRSTAKINGSDSDDFPPIPNVESGVAIKIEPQILHNAVDRVAFAAATEDSRPVLTGIKMDIEGDSFTLAAADGFRLAVYKGKLAEAVSEDVSFIIPARALQEVNRLIGDQKQPVEFTVTPSKSQALFRLENIERKTRVEVVTQLVQGAFPNYSQLIPKSYDTKSVVSVEDFLRATRTASIFARDGSGILKLQMSEGEVGGDGRLDILSSGDGVGENEGVVDATVEGPESKIAFNSKYLVDVLSVLGHGKVALEMTSASSPGVLRPVDDHDYIHVVMPMFVQW